MTKPRTAHRSRSFKPVKPLTPVNPLKGDGTGQWKTALTCIEPNKILMRGYPLDEIMGRLTFGESIYLLLMGEVPSPSIGSLMEAILVSFIDHGATPPSTIAARNAASTGASVRGSIATGVNFQFISRQGVLDEVHTFNATTVLNVRYGFNRFIRGRWEMIWCRAILVGTLVGLWMKCARGTKLRSDCIGIRR